MPTPSIDNRVELAQDSTHFHNVFRFFTVFFHSATSAEIEKTLRRSLRQRSTHDRHFMCKKNEGKKLRAVDIMQQISSEV